MQTIVLYYGVNLDILRRYLPDAAVDLVDLDPPFVTDAQLRLCHRPRDADGAQSCAS
jgi:hypothetical protein